MLVGNILKSIASSNYVQGLLGQSYNSDIQPSVQAHCSHNQIFQTEYDNALQLPQDRIRHSMSPSTSVSLTCSNGNPQATISWPESNEMPQKLICTPKGLQIIPNGNTFGRNNRSTVFEIENPYNLSDRRKPMINLSPICAPIDDTLPEHDSFSTAFWDQPLPDVRMKGEHGYEFIIPRRRTKDERDAIVRRAFGKLFSRMIIGLYFCGRPDHVELLLKLALLKQNPLIFEENRVAMQNPAVPAEPLPEHGRL
jgi:hypothetical protein